LLDILSADERPSAVLIDASSDSDPVATVRALRHLGNLSPSALVGVEVPAAMVPTLLAAGVDEAVAEGARADELGARLWHALEARQMRERLRLARVRAQALMSVGEATTADGELEPMLDRAVRAVAEGLPAERCSVVLFEPESKRSWVMAAHDEPGLRRLPIDLERYPELRLAMDSRQLVMIADSHKHPLLAEVRSYISGLPAYAIVVAPLFAGEHALGALFLRCTTERSFEPEDESFVRAAAHSLATALRSARVHEQIHLDRRELEVVYTPRLAELRQANRALREAARKKDELLEVCAHDLRVPIQILRLRASLVRGADEEDRRHLTVIGNSIARLQELVSGVLERGARFADPFQPARLDLCGLVLECAPGLRTLTDAARLELIFEVGREPLWVAGDVNALKQVIENLVNNAIEHTPTGGRLRVSVQAEGGERAVVEVQDTGSGIAAERSSTIFERYDSEQAGSGRGLGLAICRDIIETHGGAIWVRPEQVGTTFVFELPILPA
jgi:signal transduction histidine kinase